MNDPIKLAVIFGGRSGEHGVSCLTAATVLNALDPQRYQVTCIGIAPSGRWTLVETATAAAMKTVDRLLPQVSESGPEVVLVGSGRGPALAVRDGDRLLDQRQLDVAFSLLHGPYGEDGTIQGLFEMHALPYVGGGVAASANGMDKHLMKACFAAAGLPQARYEVITDRAWTSDPAACLDRLAGLELPLFVKPSRGGSSIGVTRVKERSQLSAAIETARQHDPKVLVEQGVLGRELECGVIGGRGQADPRVSVVGEVRMLDDATFYDFDAKYLPQDQVVFEIPAEVSPAVAERMQQVSIQAFDAIGAEGLSRVDAFVTGDGEILVNEINTLPGFTPFSMFPQLWQSSGMTYAALVDELIELALERPLGLH